MEWRWVTEESLDSPGGEVEWSGVEAPLEVAPIHDQTCQAGGGYEILSYDQHD